MQNSSPWIGLVTAIIALFTSVISLVTSCDNYKKTNQIMEKVEDLRNCRNEVVVNISEPKDGAQIPTITDVLGKSTLHSNCRYVFLIAKDFSSTEGTRWKVVDITQLQNDGRWSGRVRLDHIPSGEKVSLVAYVTGNAGAYQPMQILNSPPDFGMPSNFIKVTVRSSE